MPLRTKEERRIETNVIIKSLNDLKINTGYSEVRELYKCIQTYVNDGVRQEIDIPFPAISRRIKGVLAQIKKKKYGSSWNIMNCIIKTRTKIVRIFLFVKIIISA
jgi:hypothetical protein